MHEWIKDIEMLTLKDYKVTREQVLKAALLIPRDSSYRLGCTTMIEDQIIDTLNKIADYNCGIFGGLVKNFQLILWHIDVFWELVGINPNYRLYFYPSGESVNNLIDELGRNVAKEAVLNWEIFCEFSPMH